MTFLKLFSDSQKLLNTLHLLIGIINIYFRIISHLLMQVFSFFSSTYFLLFFINIIICLLCLLFFLIILLYFLILIFLVFFLPLFFSFNFLDNLFQSVFRQACSVYIILLRKLFHLLFIKSLLVLSLIYIHLYFIKIINIKLISSNSAVLVCSFFNSVFEVLNNVKISLA